MTPWEPVQGRSAGLIYCRAHMVWGAGSCPLCVGLWAYPELLPDQTRETPDMFCDEREAQS